MPENIVSGRKEFEDYKVLRKKAEEIIARLDEKPSEHKNYDIRQLLAELNIFHIELELQNDELRGTRDRLEASHRYMSSLFHHSPVAYLVLTMEEEIQEVNKAATELFQLSPHILTGRRFRSFIPESAFSTYLDSIKKLLESSEAVHTEIPMQITGKKRFWAALAFSVIEDSRENRNRESRDRENRNRENRKMILCAMTDISVRKEAEKILRDSGKILEEKVNIRTRQLATANEELKEKISELRNTRKELLKEKEKAETASRVKSEFLANVSHELRTPLNAILGYSGILKKDKSLAESQQGAVEVIEQNGKRLLEIITDILDISSIESGRQTLEESDFHLPAFLEEVSALPKFRAIQKGLDFRFLPDADLPQGVKSDEKKLRQILQHLLNNAVKFTRQGYIVFRVIIISRDDISRNIRLRFQVEDSGSGIPENRLSDIFSPFTQLGGLMNKSEGTGLGLSICRDLTEMMGGKLEIRSTEGKGSVFYADLEMSTLSQWEESSGKRMAKDSRGFIRGYTVGDLPGEEVDNTGIFRILVADEDPKSRKLLSGLLLPLGFEVAEAGEEKDMQAKLSSFMPDLIFMDMNLNYSSTVRWIWNTPVLQHIRIIGLGEKMSYSDERQSFKAHFDDIVQKPLDMQSLYDKLRTCLPLEWIYESGENPDMTEPEESGEEIIPPPLSVVRDIYSFAEICDYSGIFSQLEKIEQESSEYREFTVRLKKMAKLFRDDEIILFLKKYLEEENRG